MIKKQTILLFLFASVALVIMSFFIKGAYNQKAQTISFLNQETVVQDAQLKLKELGFYNGEINNIFDSNTRQAVLAFQEANNLPMNSRLDVSTQKALLGIDPYGEGRPSSVYNISVSKDSPGTFKFNYKFDTSRLSSNKDEAYFDIPIAPFNEEMAKKELGEEGRFIDFGYVRDVWGYPVKENAYHSLKNVKAKEISQNKKSEGDAKNLDPGNSPGVYNCRANTSITGYFKAYFEDVALGTGVGYDDPTFGAGRRAEACQVLQDISELIMLDQTSVTPDILFMANSPVPPGALAAATAFFGYYQTNPDNGSLHKHIISQQDPTPNPGYFDALILTGFNGISWDVDSTLNPLTYDFYTVLYHEVMHALGFRGLLPATISQTNVSHQHGTFDYYSHEDSSLLNSFINHLDGLLQVPVGAPSPWFITNEVVYQGIKNILGANPDDVVPVYSPSSWEQGSSLSHFDMARSPGDIFVMHPSIGTNTTRSIHEDEKDVLCHMGYRVSGLAGCEGLSPFAQNDFYNLDTTSYCLTPLNNDLAFVGGPLTLYSFVPVTIDAGDTYSFYQNVFCGGSPSSSPINAKSVLLNTSNVQTPRVFKYKVVNNTTNRTSQSAMITISSCSNDPDEYICNGDFEIGVYSNTLLGQLPQSCPNPALPFWCVFSQTPDLYSRDFGFVMPWNSYAGVLDTYDPLVSDRYIGEWSNYTPVNIGDEIFGEAMFTQTKEVLDPGIYELTWYSVVHQNINNNTSNDMRVYISDTQPQLNSYPYDPYSINPNDIYVTTSLSDTNLIPNDSSQWNQYVVNFEVPNNGVQYKYVIFEPVWVAGASLPGINSINYFDGVSLKKVNFVNPGTNTISGYVYQDQNMNSQLDGVDQPLDGVLVGLFDAVNQTLLQTITTQNIPDIGKYEFINIPDGNYYVAIIDESVYLNITEPTINPNMLPSNEYVYDLNVSGGQVLENNFGVTLNYIQPVDVNLNLSKGLIDSTLSLFDREITWRIKIINDGPNDATNIILRDTIPFGLFYNSHSSPIQGVTFNSLTGDIYIPGITSGENISIDITTTVPNRRSVCGIKENIVELISLSQIDSTSFDNIAAAEIELRPCRLNSSNIKR